MNDKSNWLDGIAKQINQLKDTLSEKDYKKYKLRLLLCVAERIAEFSPECGQCQLFQQDISTLTQEVESIIQLANKDKRKAHVQTINRIIKHLKKQHKLVTEGQYMGIGIAIGSGIGVALGAATDSIGIPSGVGIGIAIGAALDAKAKKEGRIICPSEKTATANSTRKTKTMVLIGIGALLVAGLIAYILVRFILD